MPSDRSQAALTGRYGNVAVLDVGHVQAVACQLDYRHDIERAASQHLELYPFTGEDMARGREKDRATRRKHRKNVQRLKRLAQARRTKRVRK